MFETATLSYGPPTKRVWATAMGFTGQALLIGCALLAPADFAADLGARVPGDHAGASRRSAATAAAGSEGCAAVAPCGGNANLQGHPDRAGQRSGDCGHDR